MKKQESFGALIKKARKEKKMRQEDLVREMANAGFKIDQCNLSRWEGDRNFPEEKQRDLVMWLDTFLGLSGRLCNSFENRTTNITVKSLLKILTEIGPTKHQLESLLATLENKGMKSFSEELSKLKP